MPKGIPKSVEKGDRFGRLVFTGQTVLDFTPKSKRLVKMGVFICDCGNIVNKQLSVVLIGSTTSCNCWQKEERYIKNKTHGESGTAFYNVWNRLKIRCDDPESPDYKNYGARGISYDPLWKLFENFKKDMQDSYREGLIIDRIDVNANYSKDNCRWVEFSMSSYNTRRRVTNTSGRTGVYLRKSAVANPWRACICIDSKVKWLGHFATKEDATKAREEAELERYGQNKE